MGISLPRGTRDFNSSEAILLKKITWVAEETFKAFGFSPIETPAIETLETLNAKAYGEESEKEIYLLEGKEEGLRYDFTVPLARYMAMNKDIPLPFKRYQIGKIWRMDEPQYMRSRELIQADVDVVGSEEPISDAESIAAVALALDRIGLKNYKILINSRKILDLVLEHFGVPQGSQGAAIRAIDKLEKMGSNDVLALLKKAGMKPKQAEEMLNFMQEKGNTAETLSRVETLAEKSIGDIQNLKEIIRLLGNYEILGEIAIDLSLARGLDYYTGGIWEFVVFDGEKRLPTIAAGGRYNNLLSLYSKNSTPAVGTSLGVSRVFEIMKNGEPLRSYARIHIAYIKEENLEYAMHVANMLRAAGIYTDLGLTKRNLTKQLEYANSMKIKYVGILGNQEREANKVKLRDMVSGEEELLEVEDLIAKLKSR